MPRIDRKEVADRIYARANYCEDMAGVITTFHDREEQYEEGDRAAALRGLAASRIRASTRAATTSTGSGIASIVTR